MTSHLHLRPAVVKLIEERLCCSRCRLPLASPTWSSHSCSHTYHSQCLDPWLELDRQDTIKLTCPSTDCGSKEDVWIRCRPLEELALTWRALHRGHDEAGDVEEETTDQGDQHHNEIQTHSSTTKRQGESDGSSTGHKKVVKRVRIALPEEDQRRRAPSDGAEFDGEAELRSATSPEQVVRGNTDTDMLQDGAGDIVPSGLLTVHPPLSQTRSRQREHPDLNLPLKRPRSSTTEDEGQGLQEDTHSIPSDGSLLDTNLEDDSEASISESNSDSDAEIDNTLQMVFAASQSLAASQAAGSGRMEEANQEYEDDEESTEEEEDDEKHARRSGADKKPAEGLVFNPIDEYGAPPHSQFVRSIFA